jgi:hypothetical protein
MLVYAPFALCFVTLRGFFMHFSGTNILTRCHGASSLFSDVFVFQKSYTGNILGIGRNKKLKFLFFPIWDGVQSRDGGRPEGGHTPPQCGSPPCRAGDWCGPLVHLLTSPFRLYILLDEKTLRTRSNFLEHILQATTIIDVRSGGSRSSSRHPAGEGNHHRRPPSSPCLPPEWCVISLPWTTGP